MLFAIRFFDKPNALETRAANMSAHLEWLALHSDVILVGGSLREHEEAPPKGALWIAQCGDRKILDALIRTDPFWIAGLRNTYEIFSWHKAFSKLVSI